jgi:electron transfer flavoprotein alpha subunit
MSEKLLCLITTTEDGTLDRATLESLALASQLKSESAAELVIGCIGKQPAEGIGNCKADQYMIVSGDSFESSRYSTDVAAAEALLNAAGSSVVIAASTPRIQRFLSGLAARMNGVVDTHVTGIELEGDALTVTRWFYKQRIESQISRKNVRPWIMSVTSGCADALQTGDAVTWEAVAAPEVSTKTVVKEIEATSEGDQTIRPESDLLFVAGAGWTKKQADDTVKSDQASDLILNFITRRKASLGSSKSMVDLSSEGAAVLPFLSHLHQIGQTGATPHHPKGLATCCHGEEPHTVGWRFIKERRAINSDANCGWAHGKADVLYVADAFEVMAKVNEKL